MNYLPLLRNATPALFRTTHFAPQLPCRFPPTTFSSLPAINSWFTPSGSINFPFFNALTQDDLATLVTAEASTSNTFERIELPLYIFLQYLASPPPPTAGLPNLYLAQFSLLDAVPALRPSLPTPNLVTDAGRGDIYATNLWLGRSENINTPLHKDPNPNLFVQLAGKKRVRMFEPDVGKEMIGVAGGGRWRSEEEMMLGGEKKRIEEVVWGEASKGWEVEVGPGDGVFVPKGWWHAVKGVGEGVGGSVNWWFR